MILIPSTTGSLRLFAALALLGSAAAAQDAVPAPAQQTAKRVARVWEELKYAPLKPITLPHIDEFTLSNGMRVLLLENHELPLLHGVAIVRTGNLFDPPDKIGLATITGEVLRSGGTRSTTGDELDVKLEDVAASVESNIGESYGTVSFSCLKPNEAQVMSIFEDVLANAEFRQDKLDLIKRQMMSVISRRNDEPGQIAQREFSSILFGKNDPYGWDTQYATVGNIQRADVVAFYQRYFFPANVILGIQGDFDSADMKQRLETLFSSWTAKQDTVPPFPSVHFDYKPGAYLAVKSDVNQTNFIMGQRGGERKSPDYPALEVMSDILGSGFNSRLFRRIRTQLGYVYDVDANWAANWDHPGMFVINGSTKSSTTVPAIRAAREEVERIRTDLVTEEELEGAKDTVLNSFVFALDTPSKVLSRLLIYEYFGYPKDFIFQYQKAVKALRREDILRVAKRYLDPSNFIVLAVGNPKEFGEPLDKLGEKVETLDLTIPTPPGMRNGSPSPGETGGSAQ